MSVHGISRITVALVWVYHGLVPKLLGPHEDEIRLAMLHGLPAEQLPLWLKLVGIAEIVFGIIVLSTWSSRWPFICSGLMLVILLVDVAVVAPEYLLATFNPVSLNVSLIALCIIGFITTKRTVKT